MHTIHQQDQVFQKLFGRQELLSGADYKYSQFNLALRFKNRSFLFNTITKQMVELEGALPKGSIFSAREIGDNKALYELMQGYYLVLVSSNECGFYLSVSSLLHTFYRIKNYRSYTILPTYACNARCVYCYESGIKPTRMSEATVNETIEFIKNTCSKTEPISLIWFGGEPLLEHSIISSFCAALSDTSIDFYSSIVTNGSLIDEGIADLMKKEWHLISAQISLDGAEADYIQRKRYYNYDNVYARVIDGIRLLAERDIAVGVRCNVDQYNIRDAAKLLDDLSKALPKKENISVHFAPLDQARTDEKSIKLWQMVSDLEPSIEQHGFKPVSLAGLNLKLRTFHCMMDNPTGSVLIAPDGRLFPCLQCPDGSSYGNVRDGITDFAVRDYYANGDALNDSCRSCQFLPDCTALNKCPVKDYDCKSVRMLRANAALKRLVELYDRDQSHETCSANELSEREKLVSELFVD